MTTTKLRNNIEERMRIERNLQKEWEAVKVSTVFINATMKIQIPLKYTDLFASLQNNWGECVGCVRLEECGNMDDD